MGGNRRHQKARFRGRKPADSAADSADARPAAAGETVQKLRGENEGLRHRLQAAEEVLEDLGGRSQEASRIALQNRQLWDRLESLRAAKQDLEARLSACEDAAEEVKRPEADRGAAKRITDVNATDGKGRRTEKVTRPRASSVDSDDRPPHKTWPLAPTGLSGTFIEMPISEVVQMLATTRKTGLLAIDSGARHGRKTGAMWFRDGQVVGCEFMTPKGVLVDQEAFYAMMALTEGSFELASEAITFEPRIHAPVHRLLMEAARRLDEQTRGGG